LRSGACREKALTPRGTGAASTSSRLDRREIFQPVDGFTVSIYRDAWRLAARDQQSPRTVIPTPHFAITSKSSGIKHVRSAQAHACLEGISAVTVFAYDFDAQAAFRDT
jgi:hypothetical protein